jgi:peptidoglycan hydrolase-like protein with peptidoglycan-binding domain
MQTLRIGSHGHEVTFLQRLLNRDGANPYLTEDGVFGPRTQAALIAFQRGHSIPQANGVAESTTWQCFAPITERMHNIVGYSQPTDMTCWSAAATMMTGTNQSISRGSAITEADGSLRMRIANIETFLNGLGWRLINNTSQPPISQVIQAVQRGPLWVAFQGRAAAHAVVLSGVLHCAAANSTDTVFRVHDPWPPNARRTSVYGTTYHGGSMWLRSVRPALAGMIQYMAQP